MRYCVNCGAMNDTDAKFCSGCGKKFDSAPQENTPQSDYTTQGQNTNYNRTFEQNGNQNANDYAYQQKIYGADPYTQNQNTYSGGAGMPESRFKGYSIASMILGICSVVFSFIIPLLPFVAAIVGLVLGNKVKLYGDTGMAKAGRITSIIGIVLFGIYVLLVILLTIGITTYVASDPGALNDLYHFIEQYSVIY